MRYHALHHISAKTWLSQKCNSSSGCSALEQEVDAYVRLVIESLPATEKRLHEIKTHQRSDKVCQQLTFARSSGWPEKSLLKGPVKKYYAVSSQLSVNGHHTKWRALSRLLLFPVTFIVVFPALGPKESASHQETRVSAYSLAQWL